MCCSRKLAPIRACEDASRGDWSNQVPIISGVIGPRAYKRRAIDLVLSLSQTLSGWQLIENQAILLWDEGSLQTYWLDSRRSAPVAGNA